MKELTLEVPPTYPYLLLCVVILNIYVLLMPYFVVIPKRNKIMNPRFMLQFVREHFISFGISQQPNLMAGFPD